MDEIESQVKRGQTKVNKIIRSGEMQKENARINRDLETKGTQTIDYKDVLKTTEKIYGRKNKKN